MKAKKRFLLLLGIGIAVAGAAVALQQAKQVKQRKAQSLRRWHPITVNRDPGDVSPKSEMLKPLLDLGEVVSVRVTPALGDKGTEIAARITDENMPPPEALQLLKKIRSALRNTQWLLETGEPLRSDNSPKIHSEPLSLPAKIVARQAEKGGRL